MSYIICLMLVSLFALGALILAFIILEIHLRLKVKELRNRMKEHKATYSFDIVYKTEHRKALEWRNFLIWGMALSGIICALSSIICKIS